jgi:hypothetical protein
VFIFIKAVTVLMKKLFLCLVSLVFLAAGCLTQPNPQPTAFPSVPYASMPAIPTITLPDIYATPSPEPSVAYQPPAGCITMQPTEVLHDPQGRHPPEAFGIYATFLIVVRPDGHFYEYIWDNATEKQSIYEPRVCFLNATGSETVGLTILNELGFSANVTYQEYEQATMPPDDMLGINPDIPYVEVTSLDDGSVIARVDILDFPAWPENKHGPGYR